MKKKKKKILDEYSAKIYEIDNHIFISITKKKYKLTKICANKYYLELMFIFLNIFQKYKFMRNFILTETLFWGRKDKKRQKKNLVVILLELIQVNVMMKIMTLVEHKHLLVSVKTDD